MAVTILVFKQEPHIALIFSAVVAALVARSQGHTWSSLEAGMVETLTVGLKAILILMVIGILIALWIAGGVVPYLIYLGLELLHPRIFLPAACLICAIVSLATGSSWTTAGTVGVALMGVGGGLGIALPMVAGAVVSGAYFGDKMSPLSDSTNLAAAVTGVELFTHIRHMLITTAPAFAAALVLYGALGLFISPAIVTAEAVHLIQTTLRENFFLHPLLLLAPLLVVILSVRKVSALPALIAAAGIGAVLALGLQSLSVGAIMSLAYEGFQSATGNAEVDKLLTRGGLESMMYAVSLILCALAFGGIMERSRMIESLAGAVLARVRSTGGLVTATAGTCVGMNLTAPDQYLSIIIPGRMYQHAYRQQRLHPKNLSRTLEDAGTLTSALVPWNTCGAAMMLALSVSPFVYLPYAFFNILTPLVAIAWAYLGIGQARLDAEKSGMSPKA